MAGRFAADEHPVLATDGDGTHGSLGRVVVNRQVTVVKRAIQRGPLIERVRRRFARQAFGKEHFGVELCLQIVQQQT